MPKSNIPSEDVAADPVDTQFADAHSLLFGEYMRNTEPADRNVAAFAKFLTSKKDG